MRRRFPLPGQNGFPFNQRRQAFEAQIAEAHTMFENGQYLESAQIFENLAITANSRLGPRAPRFFIQAGRAYIYAGLVNKGSPLIEKGLSLLIQSGHIEIARHTAWRIQNELKTLGLDNSIVLPEMLTDAPPAPPVAAPISLPLKCPFCGGPVYPDEIKWLDHTTAECAYCASPIRT